ncbi:hypothetical protein [Stenotrophomonas maltophilia]|uniref:hypothetical protein n=1 Tax=Stenotrophomonas maltophilia TaxID=40324 RepID=UPI0013DD3E9F|nr:hypothetical protein [Stenotrophomonas maltophilia]
MSTKSVQIPAPNIQVATFRIIGTAPFVQAKFSAKAKNAIRETQEAGSQAKSKKVRQPKDFDALCDEAVHYSKEGWPGIPAGAFRAGMISACRLVGFKMTLAKLAVFVEADGYDADDGTALVKLIAGPYRRVDLHVRNATGVVDLRTRPMWDQWASDVRIRYDADQFSLTDVSNLIARVGAQVGVGEGRPDSKASAGMGWGTFRLANEQDMKS